MTIWWLIRLRLAMWVLKAAWTVTRWAVAAAVLVVALPVTLVTVTGLAGARLRGWPPARLWRAAAWTLPGTAAYLAAAVVSARRPEALWLWPASGWDRAVHDVLAGRVLAAAVRTAPLALPAGLALAAALWARRIRRIEAGISGRTATATVVFDARQWRRAARAARGRAAAPGAVPLLDSRGRIVMGATIRAVGHRWRPTLTVDPAAMGRHQVIIGTSGSGKTNLMLRAWAGWFAATLARFLAGKSDRPLLAAVDCKGGPDARAKAARARRLLHAAGARRVAIWPDEATLSLWALPPRDRKSVV